MGLEEDTQKLGMELTVKVLQVIVFVASVGDTYWRVSRGQDPDNFVAAILLVYALIGIGWLCHIVARAHLRKRIK